MIRNRSLLFKFILFFSGSCTLIFLLIIGLNHRFSKRILMENIRESAENLTLRTVNKIETVLIAVKKIPENLAYFMEEGNIDKEHMIELIKMVVENNEEIYGVAIAYEPYAFDGTSLYFSPYYAREKDGLKFYYLGDETYRYFYMDWYQIPRELEKSVWTEPYFDDVIMTTYSVPFYEKTPEGRKLKGMVTADIALEWLTDIVSSIKVLKTGYAFLVSKNGTIITHPTQRLIMNETIFSVAEARKDAALREIGRSMLRQESGFVPFVSIVGDKKCWMYYATVPSTGWTLGVVFPEDELMDDIRRNTLTVTLLGSIGILLLVAVIVILSSSVTRPLRQMSKAAQAIGQGNLDVALPLVKSNDEVGRLKEAFQNMQVSLKDYIRKLTEATAAKERIESELKIAREIQTGMLPRIFPPFPGRKEFDIFAMMEPAKEVGGDFYDFVLIDNTRLFFVMGDVSGKGVPAALFMMITKTLLKNEALQGSSSDQILNRVNSILALDNNSAMFATVFCGILDIETGEVEFSNAGHNPPLLCRQDEDFEFLEVEKGFVLGPMDSFKYKSNKIKLGHGDCLFLYTDGVTEAMDTGKKFFSEKKLKVALSGLKGKDITAIVHELRNAISAFTQGEPQSDDITMLIVKFN